ncbi:MAG: Lrp/AsnC family transcriptional regulator [Candidatus Micrarchaeota archaeon]|nr:Lrp/AsnC family transcriptional regulator [Candidatus Micrarchaeota archaeon]
MDELTEEIIVKLDSGTVKYTDIAKKLNEPLSTIHFRMKKLEKEGVIRNYKGDIDWKKAGYPITAYIFVNIDVDLLKKIHKTQDDLLNELLGLMYIREGSLITGEADILLKVIAKSSEHLKEILLGFIDSKHGVVKTKTSLVLD